ncbi:MAG: SDR family oxidoreductase [Ardenticatenaceae bacterium]
MKRILTVGATSAIAHETLKHFANDAENSGAQLFLVGRHLAKLEAVANDLKVRGAKEVTTFQLDMNDFDRHSELLTRAQEALGGTIDLLFVAYGTLPEQKDCEEDVEVALHSFSTNAVSVISLLTLAAPIFERQKHGTIAVISSVAGDRGRRYNYLYGSAKAAVSTFLQGLRSRLFPSGVAVVTIKPGPIDTPMTAKHRKSFLFASKEKAGADIYRAIIKGKATAYVPGFWQLIMTIIKLIPEVIFKRTNLGA